MDFSGVEAFLRPKMLLFLSIDLAGSTAIKQGENYPLKAPAEGDTPSDLRAGWFSEIENFYRDIDIIFSEQWSRYEAEISSQNGASAGERPNFWKANGDEVIYVKKIGSPAECRAFVFCWAETLKKYREQIKYRKQNKEKPGPKLDAKAAAWVAGFPIANTEVVLNSAPVDVDGIENFGDRTFWHFHWLDKWHSDPNERQNLVKDYIGPSIDTGFRLAAMSTPRKMMISIETAFILAVAESEKPSDAESEKPSDKLPFCFDGWKNLKGVLGGVPYPLFWVDVGAKDPLHDAEDNLLPPPKANYKHVQEYAQKFFEAHKKTIFKPFMEGCSDADLQDLPENYKAHLDHLNRQWLNVKKIRSDQTEEEDRSTSEISSEDLEKNVSREELVKNDVPDDGE